MGWNLSLLEEVTCTKGLLAVNKRCEEQVCPELLVKKSGETGSLGKWAIMSARSKDEEFVPNLLDFEEFLQVSDQERF